MSQVTRKTEIGALDATPEKRSYWSIISDYDVKTGLCELVDNAIDIWSTSGRTSMLNVQIDLDVDRQMITFTDNAGGVRHEDLRLLVSPGASKNSPDGHTIGIFGVGSKRAVVALGELVSIRTHHSEDRAYQVDLNREWLESDNWEIPEYEIPYFPSGTTSVELAALRRVISQDDIDILSLHLSEVYANYFCSNFSISVNGNQLIPVYFDKWAYPPSYPPEKVTFPLVIEKNPPIEITITAGLILDRVPDGSNYGVYFYCNERLIVKELRTREVGYYVSAEAGVPHPDASLTRVIVSLRGPAKLMPWTSNKTGINLDHPTFVSIRPTIIQLLSQFTRLSRAFKGQWDEKVFPFKSGKIAKIDSQEIKSRKKLILPPLPRVTKSHVELLKARNRKRIEKWPWTLGLVEAMAAVDIIQRQRLQTKNRIALWLLDSTFEIALKEYIVHNPDLFPSVNLKKLFENRDDVIREVAKHVIFETELTGKAKHYYAIRNKLVHERATVDVVDDDIDNYASTIKKFLKRLFELDFD